MTALVDTSFLVRLRQLGTRECQVCNVALQKFLGRGDTLYWSAQVAIEFWSVATRPNKVNGLGLNPAEAEAALCEAEQWMTWLPEPPDIGARWRMLVNQYQVKGRQVHDARLVALMGFYNLKQLLTLDQDDFTRYPGITAIHPSNVR